LAGSEERTPQFENRASDENSQRLPRGESYLAKPNKESMSSATTLNHCICTLTPLLISVARSMYPI
jgi:hypothetical protein